MNNKELLINTNAINLDVVDDVIEIMNNLGVVEFRTVDAILGKLGTTLKITDYSNKIFYVGLSEYGFVEIVRLDSVDGKIVYMPID